MAQKVVSMASRPSRSRGAGGGRNRRRTTAPNVLQALRERIVRQEIAPGSKLRENELAQEFGVPRTRIREAFSVLEQRELIERIPNRGAVVARLDLSQVFHIYDVREVLEGLCARLATQNVAPESWQDLLDLFSGPMKKSVEKNDFDAFLAGYASFRQRLATAADNPVLTQMLDSIYEKTQALIRRIIILPGRAEIGLREHRAVLEAMRKGDAEAAEQLRRANMRSAKEYLRQFQKYVL
ncbi:MAG TPA: GntR family transcriptional regulator [Burkholderiales bacterium]|nr:GntR family transcriptional regulator [Burkholderiales bacterium]